MKRICSLGIAVIAGLACVQPVQAGSRSGGGHSFSGGNSFSGGSRGYSPGGSRGYYGGGARFYGAARYSSGAGYHNRSYLPNGPRYSASAAQFRNPTYLNNRTRSNSNRTTAYNSYSTARARYAGARGSGLSNGQRVVARHSANWQPNWNRNHDHFWRGHRCHFRNGFWFVYDPLFWDPYLYGYGYYPYGGYYDGGYYDDGYSDSGSYNNVPYDNGYSSNEYSAPADSNQPQSQTDSRVSDIQSALARAGYYDGPIDGRLGETTRKALRRYQRDRGLDVTGSINRAVVDALRVR